MSQYDHDIDEIIVFEELYKNGKNESRPATQLYDALKNNKRIYRKISWTTLFKHLTILCEKGIIEKKSSPIAQKRKRKNNEMPYTLTPAALSKIELGILNLEKLVETNREHPARKEEIQRTKREKVLTLLLLQAVDGSSRLIEADPQEPKPGVTLARSIKTGKMTLRNFDTKEGVTAMDIVESRDRSNAGLFSHIKFNETDVKKYFDALIYELKSVGLYDVIIRKMSEMAKKSFSSKTTACAALSMVSRF
jgi:hypothetical protein